MFPTLSQDVMRFITRDNQTWAIGYGLLFNDRSSPNWIERSDLYNTYWDKNTDFVMEAYPVEGKPLVFHHGMDDEVGVYPIGTVVRAELRDKGLWFEARLDELNQYIEQIKELDRRAREATGRGLGFSIATYPGMLRQAPDGHIDQWPISEVTLTHLPGDFRNQITVEMRMADLDELFPVIEDTKPAQDNAQLTQDLSSMPVNTAQLQGILARFAKEIHGIIAATSETDGQPTPVTEHETVAAIANVVATAVGDQLTTAPDEAAVRTIVETYLNANRSTLINSVVNDAVRGAMDRRAADELIVRQALNNARPNRPVSDSFGVTPPAPTSPQQARISDMRDLRYDHLTSDELLCGLALSLSHIPAARRAHVTLAESGLSEAYLRATVTRALDDRTAPKFTDPKSGLAFRSAFGALGKSGSSAMRADEISSTSLSGYGADWVGTAYGTTVWEQVRFNTNLYGLLRQKGLDEVEVPQGSSTFVMPVEGSDPTAYAVSEVNDLTADGYPGQAFTSSKIGTANRTMSLGVFGIRTAYSMLLEEDSLISELAEHTRKMRVKMDEYIESLLLNGDTTLTANTNINLIDGTPTTQFYIVQNGIRKTALANAVDGLSSYQMTYWMKAIRKLPKAAYSNRKKNMLFVLDTDTHQVVSLYPKLLTENPSQAEMDMFRTGDIDPNTGVSVYTSGFLELSNTAGKISATPANNTLGTLLCVLAPYWRVAWRRDVTFEMMYWPGSQVQELFMHIRMGIKDRSSDAASAVYAINVTPPSV